MTHFQFVEAALEALWQDARVRQRLKKQVASKLLKVGMEPESNLRKRCF